MTKRLNHDEAREILLNGGKVDGHYSVLHSYTCNPIEFNNKKLRLEDCEGDLIEFDNFAYFTEHKEPKTFEGWVNIYSNRLMVGHKTRGEADACATSDRIACIKVSGKEGDGLE